MNKDPRSVKRELIRGELIEVTVARLAELPLRITDTLDLSRLVAHEDVRADRDSMLVARDEIPA